MIIQTRNHSENQVIISTEDLQKLVEMAGNIEPIEITKELSAEEIEAREDEFERKLLAEGFINSDVNFDKPNKLFCAFFQFARTGAF